MARPTFIPLSNLSQHCICDKGYIKCSQQNWSCLQMLKTQILTLHIIIEIFQFQLTSVWFTGCMTEWNLMAKLLYTQWEYKKETQVKTNKTQLRFLLFCFTPTFSWHSAQENSWTQTNLHPSSRKCRSRSVVGKFKGLFFSVVLGFNNSWDFPRR